MPSKTPHNRGPSSAGVKVTLIKNDRVELEPWTIVIRDKGYRSSGWSQFGGVVIGFGPGVDQHAGDLDELTYLRKFLNSGAQSDPELGTIVPWKDAPEDVRKRVWKELSEDENGMRKE